MDVSLASLLAIIGVSLGILEIAILGFGTVFLLFIAIGCLVTALLMFFGALPDTYLVAAIAVAIISSVAALLLWKPLKKMQDKQQNPDDQPNVFSGLKFRLDADLAPNTSFTHRYLFNTNEAIRKNIYISFRLAKKQSFFVLCIYVFKNNKKQCFSFYSMHGA